MADRIYVFSDDRFENICFNHLDQWEDFDTIRQLLSEIEEVEYLGSPLEGPYSRYLDFAYSDLHFTLFFHEDIGVGLRIPKNRVADEIDKLKQLVDSLVNKL